MSKRYPWPEWFRSGTFELRQGEHYSCGQLSMVSQVRNAGLRYGMSLNIKTFSDRLVITVLPPREKANGSSEANH